ncbi:MAG: hypothetical protein S4CHLAM20_04050 [Chlamydiia bacterium]|nr:hypothetical protein [Chlamydiia bacterium]
MAYFINCSCYLETATSLKDKLKKYDALISAMYTSAEKAALNGDIDEYSLDDGQTKIRNIYRSPEDLIKAIKALEQLRQIVHGKICGNVTVLRDCNSLR